MSRPVHHFWHLFKPILRLIQGGNFMAKSGPQCLIGTPYNIAVLVVSSAVVQTCFITSFPKHLIGVGDQQNYVRSLLCGSKTLFVI